MYKAQKFPSYDSKGAIRKNFSLKYSKIDSYFQQNVKK